jgi:ribosome recycling factor
MEPQVIINLAGATLIAMMGWFARQLWDAVRELRQDLHRIEMDLPSNYMRRDDFREGMKEIKDLFGEVFKKIDDLKEKKADK